VLPAQAELLGPSPYTTTTFDDSPFQPAMGFSYLHREDFDDHELNTPGVIASAGAPAARRFNGSRIDQVGRLGGCPDGALTVLCDTWFSDGGATGVSFTFDAAALGRLPTAVGIVWTDGAGTITFEAFDQNGVSLGTLTGDHADGSTSGTTVDDRFYGVTNAGGIWRIHISNSSGGIEVDHLQYGFVPEIPVANAGPDQTVAEGSDVTLNGSASVGTALTYAWTQVAGPSVELTGVDTVSPTFRAPYVLPGGMTLTFALVVCEITTSNCGNPNTVSDPDTVDVLITNINQAPVAQAGPDQTVGEGSRVDLDGRASYDPDMDSLTYRWSQIPESTVILDNPLSSTPTFEAPLIGQSGGRLDFELVVTDPHGLSHVDQVSVFLTNVNQAPTADAGPDQTRNPQTTVALDGSASVDPDDDALTYTWTQTTGPSVALTGATTVSPTFTTPEVTAGVEVLTFELLVQDGQGGGAVDSVQIAVVNANEPPVCSLAQASPNLLWPPSHAMAHVTIVGLTDSSNEPPIITYRRVAQDEPTAGPGDGDSSPDAIVSGNDILLRAERAGRGDGRVYVVHFTATNAHGAECAGMVKVTVPHNVHEPAVEGPELYDSFLP
jgi:hypothetical protein